MTKTEHLLMGKQIECLLKEIRELQAGIINLEADAAVITLSDELANTSEEIGALQWRYDNEEITDDEQE